MKSFLLVLTTFASMLGVVSAQVPAAGKEPPVPFPELKHYAPLWEKSLFTTRDLPSPDAPAGPLFTDALSLVGVYEVDGQVVAVLVDRTTSLISEARLNAENENGIRIRKVTPGATMDKTRVQLQKGDQAGWVAFAETPAAPAPAAPALQTRPAGGQPVVSPLLPPLPTQGPAQPVTPKGDVPLPPP